MSASRSMPVWLRWVFGTIGVLIALAALWFLGRSGLELWRLGHSSEGLMVKSGQVLAIDLAKLLGGFIGALLGTWIAQKSFKKKSASESLVAAQAAKTRGRPCRRGSARQTPIPQTLAIRQCPPRRQ